MTNDPPSPVVPPEPTPDSAAPLEPTQSSARASRRRLSALVVALLLAGLAYRSLVGHELEQTSLLFVGIPLLFALLLVQTGPAKTGLGFVLRGATLGLLMSMIVLGEGMVCILMAAPIIYGVILTAWLLVKLISHWVGGTVARCSVVLPLALMSLEGSSERLSFPRRQTVVATRTTTATPADIAANLAGPVRFDTALPTLLQAGFPRPQWIEAEGIEPGDTWTVRFAGGEGQPGLLELRVVEATPTSVRFETREDTTKIAHWLTWRGAEVRWVPTSAGTRVTWSLTYDRELDPAWYFGPLQRYAVEQAAGFLLDNLAVPERTAGERATPMREHGVETPATKRRV